MDKENELQKSLNNMTDLLRLASSIKVLSRDTVVYRNNLAELLERVKRAETDMQEADKRLQCLITERDALLLKLSADLNLYVSGNIPNEEQQTLNLLESSGFIDYIGRSI